MSQPETKQPALSWQDLICRLEGVHAAKVVLSTDSIPEEIHVLAGTTKSPKALTRDIQSALMAVYGIDVDYRIISIAQVHSDLTDRDCRLCYSGIDNRFIDGHGEVTVFLSHGDFRVDGKASYTTRNRPSFLRGVAVAALDAIAKCVSVKAGGHFELITVEEVDAGGQPAALVTLCDEQGQHFIGSSFIRDNHDDAVVRAVLDALNRRISRLIAG